MGGGGGGSSEKRHNDVSRGRNRYVTLPLYACSTNYPQYTEKQKSVTITTSISEL